MDVNNFFLKNFKKTCRFAAKFFKDGNSKTFSGLQAVKRLGS